MTNRSKTHAAVFVGVNQPIELRQFAMPDLLPGQVLVRIKLATVCGSDLHTWQGHRDAPVPMVLGHEMVGVIEGFGPGERPCDLADGQLECGDRVVWSVGARCGACFFCTHGLPQKCERLFKYGHEPMRDGSRLSGGLAEHCVLVPGTAIVRLPDDLPDAVASPAGCATATVCSAFRAAGSLRGQTVLIQGLGALGLTACAMAKAMGAAYVIGCEPQPEARATAAQFGATHALTPNAPIAAEEMIHRLTNGRGVDAAFEFSGSCRAIAFGMPLLRIGGRYVWVGTVCPTEPVSIAPEQVVRRHVSIHGVHNYAPQDLHDAVAFLAANQHAFPFKNLVAQTFDLEQVNEAFTYAKSRRPPRVAVRLDARL